MRLFSGQCVGTPKDCDDRNDCTVDTCSAGTCQHTNNNAYAAKLPRFRFQLLAADFCKLLCRLLCSDGNECTTGDKCNNGACVSTGTLDCNGTNSWSSSTFHEARS